VIPTIAVVGATATGKTAVGERLAEALGGEIVCADSRQVFAELEIGTGKPTPAERAVRPHHLFDALRLGDKASAGWYATAAAPVRAGIRERGHVPILVGGSGLYLNAAREGLTCVPGIEITTVHDGHDVHMLGYWLDADSAGLNAKRGRDGIIVFSENRIRLLAELQAGPG